MLTAMSLLFSFGKGKSEISCNSRQEQVRKAAFVAMTAIASRW